LPRNTRSVSYVTAARELSLAAVPPTVAPDVGWGGGGSFCVAMLCVFVRADRAYLCPAVAFFTSAEFTFRERRI